MLTEPKRVPVGTNIVRELTEGERWTTHPEGGIIVVHPDRPPLWCRVDPDGSYRQDYISGTQTPTQYIVDCVELIPGPSYHESLDTPEAKNGIYKVSTGKWTD